VNRVHEQEEEDGPKDNPFTEEQRLIRDWIFHLKLGHRDAASPRELLPELILEQEDGWRGHDYHRRGDVGDEVGELYLFHLMPCMGGLVSATAAGEGAVAKRDLETPKREREEGIKSFK
jgi:hypothetical protein